MSDADVYSLLESQEGSECPYCQISFPVGELDDHVQAHLLEFEEKEAAPQAAFSITCHECEQSIPTEEWDSHQVMHRIQNEEAGAAEKEDFEKLQAKYGFSDKRPGNCFRCKEPGHWSNDCPLNPHRKRALERVVPPERIAVLATQRPEAGETVKGIIPLLSRCFEKQAQSGPLSSVALCGSIQHFHTGRADSGFGCGWRNIQMLTSHLLSRNQEMRTALFGGCGYVPDISSMQAWLELAWAEGFDPAGREQLGGNVQASRKWVGTTEAGTLLRYFGIQAYILDFVVPGGGGDHPSVECNLCGKCPIMGDRYRSQVLDDYDLCSTCRNSPQGNDGVPYTKIPPEGRLEGGAQGQGSGKVLHAKLADWVWRYFTEPDFGIDWDEPSRAARSSSAPAQPAPRLGEGSSRDPFPTAQPGASAVPSLQSSPVILSGKPPLYFQHEGHSRTIVGVERRKNKNVAEAELVLIILDPATPSQKLRSNLTNQMGWQSLVKRGLHTLKQPKYQLLVVEGDGIVTNEERDGLKDISHAKLVKG